MYSQEIFVSYTKELTRATTGRSGKFWRDTVKKYGRRRKTALEAFLSVTNENCGRAGCETAAVAGGEKHESGWSECGYEYGRSSRGYWVSIGALGSMGEAKE